MTRKRKADAWVIESWDESEKRHAYVRSFRRALRGDGIDGGGFTYDPREAKRFSTWSSARAHARQLHRCYAVRLSEALEPPCDCMDCQINGEPTHG